MLEGRGEVVQLMALQVHGRMAGHRPPVGHRLDHLSQRRQGQGPPEANIDLLFDVDGRFHSAPVGMVFLARTRLGSCSFMMGQPNVVLRGVKQIGESHSQSEPSADF